VNLALRLEKENPEEAPVAGDRVDYVIYCGNSSKTSECACLPAEISSGKYQVDRDYYLEKQLKGPLLRILEKVVKNPSEVFQCKIIFKPRPTKGMFSTFARKRKLPELENCSEEEKSKRAAKMIFGNRNS
jgi:DNA polymerase elongation subunit (family B)